MKAKRSRRVFEPEEKITAVLSIWTERKTMTQMCREMSVSNALLNRWQDQAMEAMLNALSPKRPETTTDCFYPQNSVGQWRER